MNKTKIIVEAWQEYFNREDQPTQEDKRRSEICAACVHKRKGKMLIFVKDELKNIEGYYCGKCSCPLSALIRSKKGCELSLWDKLDTTL
jgi:hypothetical protein